MKKSLIVLAVVSALAPLAVLAKGPMCSGPVCKPNTSYLLASDDSGYTIDGTGKGAVTVLIPAGFKGVNCRIYLPGYRKPTVSKNLVFSVKNPEGAVVESGTVPANTLAMGYTFHSTLIGGEQLVLQQTAMAPVTLALTPDQHYLTLGGCVEEASSK